MSLLSNVKQLHFNAILHLLPLSSHSVPSVLAYLAYVSLDILCLGVPHGVVKPCQAYPEPIEAVIRTVDCQDRRPGVGLGHSSVSLQDDDLGPDLVVY